VGERESGGSGGERAWERGVRGGAAGVEEAVT
jgi:hypothetical protein